jgi:hypothetical protein
MKAVGHIRQNFGGACLWNARAGLAGAAWSRLVVAEARAAFRIKRFFSSRAPCGACPPVSDISASARAFEVPILTPREELVGPMGGAVESPANGSRRYAERGNAKSSTDQTATVA